MGDALIYFLRRGAPQAEGPIVARVLQRIREKLPKEPDGIPTVFVTHSLGCTIFYDLFTHFDPSLRFDLWVSVGSQLSLYEEVKILANSNAQAAVTKAPGEPGHVPVALPKGARWYNVVDPRDPLAYTSQCVFEAVRDEIYECKNDQVDEIHNAYLEEGRLFRLIEDWLKDLAAASDDQKTAPRLGAAQG
jgi:hypothetical protein